MAARDPAARLQPLIQRAEKREQKVASEFATRQQTVHEQERQLEELKRYVIEYAIAPAVSVVPALLANRVAFRNRLDEAVRQQQRKLEQSRTLVEHERLRLVLASRDTKVLEQLAEGHRVRAARTEARRVQNEHDDLAGRHRLAGEGENL